MGREGAWMRGPLAACALAALAACAPEQADGTYAHFQHLELAHVVVVGAAPGAASEAAQRLLPRLQAELGPQKHVRVVPLDQAHAGEERVRMLIGYADSPELQPALTALGFAPRGKACVALGDVVFGESGGALVATLDDPDQRGAPLTILAALGADDAAFADLDVARELRPTWQRGWQVYAVRKWLCAEGPLDASGRAVADPGAVERLQALTSELREEVPGSDQLADAERSEVRERALSALDAVAEFDGTEPAVRRHADAASLARLIRSWSTYHCAPRSGTLDLASVPGLEADVTAAYAEYYTRRAAGEPAEAWMIDGVARHVARTWWDRPLDAWCAHLQRAGLVPALEQIVAPAARISPHRIVPLRGLLLDVLLELRGNKEVRRLWREGGFAVDEELRAAFDARLRGLAERYGPQLEADARARRARVLARPFRRGVDLVPALERVDPIDSGFGSAGGARALARLDAIGADAVSLELAAFLERPWGRAALEPQSWPPAQVADLELAVACARAREHGLDVLLDPSLWLAPGATLAGATLVHTPNEWRLFFDEHRRFLEHYALVAELCGVEILSLGSELGSAAMTSREHGDPRWDEAHYAWKLARWQSEIQSARAAFSGGLTYGARWDESLDGFSFWKQLDFIGLELFAPLASESTEAITPQFNSIATRLWSSLTMAEVNAAAIGKRLLVLEVGFPSSRDAWSRPGRPAGPADELAQALFVAALGTQVQAQSSGLGKLAGLYVWCWSADEDGGAAWKRGYTLQGKRSEPALQRAFREP
jgi:hypothetical protein